MYLTGGQNYQYALRESYMKQGRTFYERVNQRNIEYYQAL